MMFPSRAAGVDVDRDQRLGLVDHDVAAGAQLHRRREHRVELALHPHPREQRLAVAVLLHRAHIRGHQHLHEIAGFLIAGFAGDQDLVDFLVVEIAQRPLDQRAFLVDQGGCLRLQGHVAHGFPHPDQIFEVALDFGLGARGAGGAQDDAHALGDVEIRHHILEPRAILRGGDLAADAAAARGVGHQYRIAAGQRQIGGQRGALVAAFFLDDLHQHHLAALDDFLDLVLTARTEGALRHLFQHIVAADGFDDLFLGLVAFVFIVVILVALRRGVFRCGCPGTFVLGMLAAMFGVWRVVGMSGVFVRVRIMLFGMRVFFLLFFAGFCRGGLDGGRIGQGHRGQRLARVSLGALVIRVIVFIVGMLMLMLMMLVIMMPAIVMAMLRIGVVMFGVLAVIALGVRLFGRRVALFMALMRDRLRRIAARVLDDLALDALATASAARIAVARTAASAGAVFALFLGLALGALFGLDRRLAVGDRNLIIVWVDFAEGQEAVAVAAIFDEGRLQ